MKIKVGSLVVPKHSLGRVASISKSEIVIEIPDKKAQAGYRTTKLTLEQAQKIGVSLEELIAEYVQQVELVNE